MSRDVITVGSTMRIPLLYPGEYSQWRERFKNYLEEQTNEKKTRKIDRLARSLLIQWLPNDIYSLINSNETTKDLWDALERQMRGSEYGEQDRKAAILYEYDTFKANEGEQLLDTYLPLVIEKTNVSKRKEKVVVSSDSEGSGADDLSELKKITALLAKAFNRRKFYSKPTSNNLRTSATSQSANKKQEFVKLDDKKEDKKADEKKRDMSKVKCYNCKKEGHFAKDCKKAKDQAQMESSSDSDQEINANMVFMAQIEKILSESDKSSSSAEETIVEKKGSSNTSNVDLSAVSLSKLNKNVKRYSRKDLLSCNNSHLQETSSAYVCNDAMNVSCNSRMCDLLDDNNFFIFDDESVRISPVSKMPFRKKPR
nr:hypothetical protein [Tanacetum cinerariifolium]